MGMKRSSPVADSCESLQPNKTLHIKTLHNTMLHNAMLHTMVLHDRMLRRRHRSATGCTDRVALIGAIERTVSLGAWHHPVPGTMISTFRVTEVARAHRGCPSLS